MGRDYLIDEFLEDLAGTGVMKSVYVQANWPKDKFEDEVAWVSQVADERGWPHANERSRRGHERAHERRRAA